MLAEGRKKREDYYDERTSELDLEESVILANLLHQKRGNPQLTKNGITAAFSVDRTSERADLMFQSLLRKGVVASNPSRYYSVPVPAMTNWLVHRFADPP